MKSTFALALAASLPFAMASPYHMLHAARDAEANEDVVIVTDVNVVAVTTQVTVYWTGEPATSAIPTSTSTAVAVPQKHQGQHNHANAHTWTIQKTTEAAPTTTSVSSTIAAPTVASPTVVTVVETPSSTPEPAPSPEPTTSTSTYEAPAWTAPAVVSSVVAAAVTKLSDPADYGSDPATPAYAAPTSGSSALDSANYQSVMLASQNAWRAKWNASDLSWDDSLASKAASWINGCPATHDPNGGASNMAWSSSLDTSFPAHLWGSEADLYKAQSQVLDLPSGPITQYRMNGGDGGGHFTQLVWKATTKTGCAIKNCGKDADNQWWATICYYDTGNGFDPAYIDVWDQYGRNGSFAYNLNWAPLW